MAGTKRKYFHLLDRLSIRSKLQAVILLVCLIVILLTSSIAYISARNALKDSIYDHLTALRTRQAIALQNYFLRLQREVRIYSNSPGVLGAFKQFQAAYNQINQEKLLPQQESRLNRYYLEEVFPRISSFSSETQDPKAFSPSSNAGRLLQYMYIANNPFDPGEKHKLDSANLENAYDKVHRRIHRNYEVAAKNFGYYDIFMIDAKSGDIIYSVAKEIDVGTNLKTGVYANTNLGKVFSKALNARDPNLTVWVDFENYRPSRDRPASFIASTIFDGSDLVGVFVFQVSLDRIEQVTTVDRKWSEVGLSNTGESILVGQDYFLRSSPRDFLEHPEQYYELLPGIGYSEVQIDSIRNSGTPILKQKIKTTAVEKAFDGLDGTELINDYRGIPILVSYQMLPMGSEFNWALLTKMDASEAFAPIDQLTRRILIASAIILPIMVLIANWFSRNFTRPIRRLIAGTRRITAGATDVRVNIEGNDEFGELGRSFNQMTQSLYEKEKSLQEKIKENERLLLNILPPEAVKRFQGGEREFADTYTDITLIYAEVEGFSQLDNKVEPEESVQLLNELIGAFDELSDKFGIEKVKTVGTTYIAACGLSVPRVDHTKRAVDLALAMIKTVEQFSRTYDAHITLDIGVHSGSVTGGIIGKSKFIYEIWGDCIKVAYAIHHSSADNVIHVSEAVRQTLSHLFAFKKVEDIEIKGMGTIPVWMIDFSMSSAMPDSKN